LLIETFDCFAEIMLITYFVFPALSTAYQVTVAQNLHEQKEQLTDADLYIVPIYHCLMVHVFKQ
jgi:hypothetical protein